MEFNAGKCHVMKYGKKWKETSTMTRSYKWKSKNMCTLLGSMRVAFTYVTEEMVKKIIASFMRRTLEYAATVFNPHKKKIYKQNRGYREQHQYGWQVWEKDLRTWDYRHYRRGQKSGYDNVVEIYWRKRKYLC